MGYLEDKAALLNKNAEGGRTDWTTADASKAISDSGMTVQQHYDRHGKSEGLAAPVWTPSKSNEENTYLTQSVTTGGFDDAAYIQNKTNALNNNPLSLRTNWTTDEVARTLTDQGFTPESHYTQFGRGEGVNPYVGKQQKFGALQGPGTTTYNPVYQKDGLGYVDPQKSTVAGQLTTLLDTNSPYIQQARRQGLLQAAQRGGVNSTASASAAQREAIAAGLQVATPDAMAHSSAQARQQEGDIASTLSAQGATQQSGLSAQEASQARILSAQNAMQQSGLSMQDASQASGLSAQESFQLSKLNNENYQYDSGKIAQQINGNLAAITNQGVIQTAIEKQAQDNAVTLKNMGIAADQVNYLNQIMGNITISALNNVSAAINNSNVSDKQAVIDILTGFLGSTTLGKGAFNITI